MRRGFHIFLILVFASIHLIGNEDVMSLISANDYISRYKAKAINEMIKHRIPASVILGQGMLESGNGNSNLARNANNHFGIKCHKEWCGETFTMDDDEKNECFRKYETVMQSYEDHSYFLTSRPRYASLFLIPKNDYIAWARGLKNAGYATHPSYAEMLIDVIEKNKLYELDSATVMVEEMPKMENERKVREHIFLSLGARKLIELLKKFDLSQLKEERLAVSTLTKENTAVTTLETSVLSDFFDDHVRADNELEQEKNSACDSRSTGEKKTTINLAKMIAAIYRDTELMNSKNEGLYFIAETSYPNCKNPVGEIKQFSWKKQVLSDTVRITHLSTAPEAPGLIPYYLPHKPLSEAKFKKKINELNYSLFLISNQLFFSDELEGGK